MSCAAARILASGPLSGRNLPALGRLWLVRSLIALARIRSERPGPSDLSSYGA